MKSSKISLSGAVLVWDASVVDFFFVLEMPCFSFACVLFIRNVESVQIQREFVRITHDDLEKAVN